MYAIKHPVVRTGPDFYLLVGEDARAVVRHSGIPQPDEPSFPQEEIDMNAGTLYAVRRRLVVLTVATLLALSAAYAPILLDGAAGTAMTSSVFACDAQSSSGGGC